MKKDRNNFFSNMFPFQNTMPTNMMMYPNFMNDNYNNIESKINNLEKKINNLENRISRLENPYQNNQNYSNNQGYQSNQYQNIPQQMPYQSTQNNNGDMYMM